MKTSTTGTPKAGRRTSMLATALALLALAGLIGAAHVFGTIFDESIQPASRAVLQINNTPEQQLITLNGTYSFDVPDGTYRLLAVGQNASAEKNVTITTDGNFHIDLILLPGVPAEDSVLTDLLSAPEVVAPSTSANEGIEPVWLIIALLIVALAAWAYVNMRRFGKTDDAKKSGPATQKARTSGPTPMPPVSVPGRVLSADQQKVMQCLSSFNNRASQKDLRRALDHWSEAKVSMELTELEEMGAIRKLKKGRGNIIRKA